MAAQNLVERLGSIYEQTFEPRKTTFVGLDDLDPVEAELLGELFAQMAVGSDVAFDDTAIASVKTDEHGFVEGVYTAGLGLNSNGDGLVAIVGKNEFPATVANNKVTIGALSFDVTVEKEEKTATRGDAEYKFHPVSLDSVLTIDGEDFLVELFAFQNVETCDDVAKIKTAFKHGGQKLFDLLRRPAPYYQYISLDLLGAGTFPIEGFMEKVCKRRSDGQSYTRQVLLLRDGLAVWCDGVLKRQVQTWVPRRNGEVLCVKTENGWEVKGGESLYLQIASVTYNEKKNRQNEVSLNAKVSARALSTKPKDFDGFTPYPEFKADGDGYICNSSAVPADVAAFRAGNTSAMSAGNTSAAIAPSTAQSAPEPAQPVQAEILAATKAVQASQSMTLAGATTASDLPF